MVETQDQETPVQPEQTDEQKQQQAAEAAKAVKAEPTPVAGPQAAKAAQTVATPVAGPQAQEVPYQHPAAPVAGPAMTNAPAAEYDPNLVPKAPTSIPTQNMTQGQQTLSRMSDVAKQNPFSVMFAREKDIHNPILRTLARVGTAAGAGMEGMSKNYPAIQDARIKEAAEPSETAQRTAQAANLNSEVQARQNPKPKMVEIPGMVGPGNQPAFRDENSTEPGAYTLGANGFEKIPETPAAGPAPNPAAPKTTPTATGGAGTSIPAQGPASPPVAGGYLSPKPQEPQRAPLATPAEAAKLAPVGTGSDNYNKQILDAVGKDAAGDFPVTPTTSHEDAEKILADARAQGGATRAQNSAERVAGAPDAAQKRKDDRTYGYALDQNNTLRYMTRSQADALQHPFEEQNPTAIKADAVAIGLLNDVQRNTSRYTKAANEYQNKVTDTTIRAKDNAVFDTLLNKSGVADLNVAIAEGGEVKIPILSSFLEGLSREARSSAYGDLSTQGKELYDGYIRNMSAIVAYQKALTNSARANKETLDLEMANIANPTMQPADIIRKQGQFQENIDTLATRFPEGIPSVKQLPKDVRQDIEGNPQGHSFSYGGRSFTNMPDDAYQRFQKANPNYKE